MSERLKTVLANFQGKKLLVLGDIMLDQYLWGMISRLSPEAPVQVVSELSRSTILGGAANTASNIKSLGGEAFLAGVVGDDEPARAVLQKLDEKGLNTKGIFTDKNRSTTSKNRVMAQNQQVVRIDKETCTQISQEISQAVASFVEEVIRTVDGIIISDYDKGVVTPQLSELVISNAQKFKKVVTVDPKGLDYSKYRNATVLCPNIKEAGLATKTEIADEETLEKVGQMLLSNLNCRGVLITKGSQGLSLFERGRPSIHIAAVNSEVFDVVGAGDTVAAALGLALISGASLYEASLIANYAAGIAVRKVGTVAVEIKELAAMIDEWEGIKSSKIKDLEQLRELVEEQRSRGKKVVFTNGCFDILHFGHLKYLREAKKLGDILIVALNSNSSVRALKGEARPWVDELERAEVLSALEFIDYTTIFDELTPEHLLATLKPDVHVKGGDYQEEELLEADLVRSYGGRVVILPYIEGKSTSGLAEKIVKTFDRKLHSKDE